MSTIDPSELSVADLLEYADQHPDETQELLDSEKAGQNRSTAVSGLESRLQRQQEGGSETPSSDEGDDEEEHEGEEGQDYYLDENGNEIRLDDGSDEYRDQLAKDGLI